MYSPVLWCPLSKDHETISANRTDLFGSYEQASKVHNELKAIVFRLKVAPIEHEVRGMLISWLSLQISLGQFWKHPCAS